MERREPRVFCAALQNISIAARLIGAPHTARVAEIIYELCEEGMHDEAKNMLEELQGEYHQTFRALLNSTNLRR